jgi:hypothetical protein
MHCFVLTNEGQWTVIQQGMSPGNSMARRYHWHSANLRSFVEEPHTAICGVNQGEILNLADRQADPARNAVLSITQEKPAWKGGRPCEGAAAATVLNVVRNAFNSSFVLRQVSEALFPDSFPATGWL